jgi:8-oxo-dGTP diphosphatase
MAESPRVGVGVVIRRGGEVLLVRRRGAHGSGTWSTPGGHLDLGETPESCARREALEETGVQLAAVEFRAMTNDVFETEGVHYVTIWMEGEYLGGEPTVRAGYEVAEVSWFSRDALPGELFLPLSNLLAGRCYPSHAGGLEAVGAGAS